MLLKRLAGALSPGLAAILPDLDRAGIRTTEHLLFTPLSVLAELVPDHRDSLGDLQEECLLLSCPAEVSAVEAAAELDALRQTQGNWVGFGCATLDELFGGWHGHGIVEIAGPTRVGKSLLVLHAVLRRLAADPTAQCRWLDADGSFSPARAQAILTGSIGVSDPKAVLDRLVVSPCFRVEPDLYNVLADIQAESSSSNEQQVKTRILVIDPISNLFKNMLLSTSSAQGYAAMVTVLEEVSQITQTHGLTTLVCNAASSSAGGNKLSAFSTTTHKPSLGTAFTFFADVTMLVQDTGRIFGLADEEERERVRRKPGLRAVVEVIKSRMSPTGGWAVMETDGTSLQSVVAPPLDDERTIRMSAGLPTGPARPIHGPLAQTVIP